MTPLLSNKKGQFMAAPIMMIIILLFLVGFIVFQMYQESKEEKICIQEGFIPEDICEAGSSVRECYLDCNSLDQDYFKQQYGGLFSGNSCSCVNQDKDVSQIW